MGLREQAIFAVYVRWATEVWTWLPSVRVMVGSWIMNHSYFIWLGSSVQTALFIQWNKCQRLSVESVRRTSITLTWWLWWDRLTLEAESEDRPTRWTASCKHNLGTGELELIKHQSRCRDNNIATVARYLGKPPQSLKQLACAHWVSAWVGINLNVDFVNSFDWLG